MGIGAGCGSRRQDPDDGVDHHHRSCLESGGEKGAVAVDAALDGNRGRWVAEKRAAAVVRG